MEIINFTSQSGNGTTVNVKIPYINQSVMKHINILMVDDHPIIIEGYQNVLMATKDKMIKPY